MVSSKGLMVGLAAALLVAAPAVSSAQQKMVELTLFGGAYFPTSDEALDAGDRPATRRSSAALGGRLAFWGSRSLGVELTAGFSPARALVDANSGSRFARGTDLAFGSAKLAFNLAPASKLGVIVSGGVAGLRPGSPLGDQAEKSTAIGGVAGLTLRFGVGENVALRGDAEGYAYSADFGLGKKGTTDLMFSGGLVIAF
ncbi:MAG: hypothetical protein R2909_07650 [Gemmatimonadales bacterium]